MSYQRNYDRDNRRRPPPPPPNRNWREPLPEEEPASQRQQRRSRPPSQRKRDSARQDAFRENHPKSKQALKDIEDKINKALYFGYGDAMTAEKQVDFSVQKTAAVVPVTTRAVGFYTQWIFKKVYELYGRRPDRIPECAPYALYRVSLAQFEYRLLCGRSSQVNTLGIDAGLFYRPRLDIEERDVIKAMPVTFSPIANLIAGVGNFEFEGETYYVKCPNDMVLGILFSNLRQVVERYSDINTPQAERQQFYDLNPLPFANWNQPARPPIRRRVEGVPVDNAFPLLLNPNDFMPPEYTIEDFEHDVHQVKNFISFVARKEIKMLNEGAILDYDSPGHQRILVSNSAEGLRNPDRHFQNDWANEELPQGPLDTFWTPVTMRSQDTFMGTMNLVGERRVGVGDAFAFRSPLIARGQARHRWTTLVDNMIA